VRTLLLAEGQGPPAGFKPAVVCDVQEHAYWGDFPNRKDLYVGAFLRNVDWTFVAGRLMTTAGLTAEINAAMEEPK
jgi:superoxide dismutase